MGYAKLYFDNSGANTITHVMHDIVGVITGTYTSNTQLTVADKTLSTVINTANSNWSFLYPATHGTKGNTNTSWVLSAPCVSSNTKLKYVRISSHSRNLGAGQSSGTTLYNASGGVKMTCATAATSNTSVSNETWYNLVTSDTLAPNFGSIVYTHYNGNYITLSWSQRHLLIFGLRSNTTTSYAFTGCFETTETPISQYRNVAPFLYFLRGHYISSSGSGSGTSLTATSPTNIGSESRDIFLQMNHYNPVTATSSGLHNIMGNINGTENYHTLLAEQTTDPSLPSTFTKSSTGQIATYMQPLFYHQLHLAIPHMYISNLSNVYRVDNDIGNNFDEFTVGSDTYVLLNQSNPSGSPYFGYPLSGFSLAVKKA